ncbi:MAG: hypothetical protein WBO74_04310, partial [Thermoanaerobaculia bacterium]
SNSVLHAIVQEQEVPVTDLREDLPPALGAVLAKSVDGPSARRNRWVALAAAFGVFALAIWLWPGTREALRGWAGSEGDERGAEIEPPATVEPETAFEFVQRGNGLLDHYYRTGYVDQAVASF